jgi:hypothetical protein
MTTSDKKTIGVSPGGEEVLRQVGGGKPFQTDLDAARFAVSLALASGPWPPPRVETGTKWNVGSFDPGGQMKVVLELLRGPVEEPYRVLEALLEVGLQHLAKHLQVHGALDLEVLLESTEKAPVASN